MVEEGVELGFVFVIPVLNPCWKDTCDDPQFRRSIVVLSISKSVEPNEEQKEMTSAFRKVFSASIEIIGKR